MVEVLQSRQTAHGGKPVLIAGAGPVGCALALYLAQAGVPVVLFESSSELPEDLRASTFHPPTLDQLDQLGLTEKLLPQGLIVRDFQFRERASGESVTLSLSSLAGRTNHPYRLQCEQYKLTRTVVDMLAQYDHAEVRMGCEVLGYRETPDGVSALVFDGQVEKAIQGSFLVGADGAGSRVRQASGTLFEGMTYPERFLVVSTTFPFEEHFEDLRWVNYVSDPEEWCVMLKTVDLWRVQFPTAADANPEMLLSDEYIQDRLQRLHPNPEQYDIHHRTLYRVHQRVAATYRVGHRVLVAGDAAHVNNPLGGMGMNGGIHDAFNLGEKLLAIIFEGASLDDMLDLYDIQRRGICVSFIQSKTKENKQSMEAKGEGAQRARREKWRALAASQEAQDAHVLESSMIKSLADCAQIKLPDRGQLVVR
ncbi:FAD-dependent oxidoreductase [Novosphingobium sp. BL-52-GroH]|uniref:FAD-dependent oxidoreductase n=1 Tax=Novosphingobium sp. BL-52-GroH TaxID=3349877 RepID=UPI00384ACC9B